MDDDHRTSSPDDGSTGGIPPADLPTSAQSLDDATFALLDLNSNLATHTVRVGNYQLKRLIGSGGMGAVYEAIQDSPRRVVALKLMRNPLKSRSNLRRFQYESQLLARLRHPGVAEVYEAGTHTAGNVSIPYYSMEFVAGAKPISEYVRDHLLGARQVLELFVKVCDAIHHAHTRGVIHRDLKPANILADDSGQPKIIDFGIARALDSDQAPATIQTRADQLLGTLQYMSPEQLDGDPSALDARSDVYSLGVILYELLCGKAPYDVDRSKLHEASRLIREEPPIPPRVANAELSRDVETILLKALQKERGRRYQSAQELGDDLRRVLDEQPIAARGDSALYLTRVRFRRAATHHRIFASVLAVLFSFAMGEVLGALIGSAGLSTAYENFLTTYFASSALPFRSVVVIGMHDGTDWVQVGKAANAGEIDSSDVRTLRRIHAALLRKLIGMDVRAVAFDIQFSKEAQGIDDDLASAARALRDDGTAVICAAPTWRVRPDGTAEISPPIAREVRWGSLLAHLSANEPWSIDLFLKPEARSIMPSLALAAVAGYWNPTLFPSFDFDGAAGVVIVRFNSPTAAPGGRLAVAQDKVVRLMRMRFMEVDHPEQGIASTDLTGQYIVQMPPTKILDRSTIDYAEVMRWTPDELRTRLAGKLIFVGDLRPKRDGPFELADGRSLCGVYAHAAAAEAIINRSEDAVRRPGYVPIGKFYVHGAYLFDLAAACAGALIAFYFYSSTVRRALGTLLFSLLLVGCSLLLFSAQRLVITPWAGLFALLLAAETVALVERRSLGQRRFKFTNGNAAVVFKESIMRRTLAMYAAISMFTLLGFCTPGCMHKEYTPTSMFGDRTTRACQMIRIDWPGTNKSFYAIGPIGSFYVQPAPDLPNEFLYRMSITKPMKMSIRPPVPSTTTTNPDMPNVIVQDGWVYLAGTDPVGVTDSVAAGAQGCEMLIRRTGDDWYVYYLSSQGGSPVNGHVQALKNHGNADRPNVGNAKFVHITTDQNGAAIIDAPADFTPASIPELKAGRDEYNARPH